VGGLLNLAQKLYRRFPDFVESQPTQASPARQHVSQLASLPSQQASQQANTKATI